MTSPNANDDTPSLLPTNDVNALFSTENDAYALIWNQVMNSPYKQVEFTTISLILNNPCNSSSSVLNDSNADLYFTLPPVSASLPLDSVPFHSSDLALDGCDPATSSYPWAGWLLFSLKHPVQQINISLHLPVHQPKFSMTLHLPPTTRTWEIWQLRPHSYPALNSSSSHLAHSLVKPCHMYHPPHTPHCCQHWMHHSLPPSSPHSPRTH